MIKGIVALFTSGLILNPMILLGIALGIYSATALDIEQMRRLFGDYRFYAIVLAISFIYVFSLKKIYKDDAESLNYQAMLLSVFIGVIRFILACALSISFVIMMFSF